MFALFTFFAIFLIVRTYLVKNEYSWYALIHSILTVWGLCHVSWDVFGCRVGNIPEFTALWYYYQAQLAFRWISLVFLLCIDKDNGVDMFLHHLFTNIVLVFSTTFNFERIGFTVLLLHDVSDVFLYLARALRKTRGEEYLGTLLAFGAFVVSFFVMRLLFLPYFVFMRCLQIAHRIEEFIAFALLVGLIILHFYWFLKIIKILRDLWTKCPPEKQS